MKKLILAAIVAFTLLPVAANAQAQIIVRVAPPAPIVERHGPPPGRGYVWIGGYQRWDGARYVWVPGRYEMPPRHHARWVEHRWVHRHGTWVFVEGHWR
ncbi:MAG TPA: YXWGXW repeat-containing protein [Terracidiphilus sp.]